MTYSRSSDRRAGSYVFDRFRLSDDGTLLLAQGNVVRVTPKVLQTLLVLVQNAGQVVTKDDLLRAVWPDTIVEDTGLTRNISVLRQALGDEEEHFIATVPRIGYRFVARVEHFETAGNDDRARPQNSLEPPISHGPRKHLTVGHRQERAEVDRAFAATQNGSGRLIAVSGEPGIGKTTIVEEFLGELDPAILVGRGRCSERLAGAEPHLAVLEALDELFSRDRTVAASLRRLAPTWFVHVAPRFGNETLEPQVPEYVPRGSAERLIRELTVFLEEISRSRPLVLFIDDLHWSDISTVDLIAHLAGRLARMRVLVIVAYRANEMVATNHPFGRLRGELLGRGQLTEIAVSLLTVADVSEYVLARLVDRNIPKELPALVHQKTEGHALFMTDLVRYLQEHGIATGSTAALTREVPESLKGMIERTLQALDEDAKQLLRLSALHGNEFESAIIAQVSERNPVLVEEQLHALARVHGLVTITREHTLPNGVFSLRCRFVHVLYQNALFASTTSSRRAEWARSIGEALAAAYEARTDLIASELAVLFEIARDFFKAAQYFLTASRAATGRFAFREASDLAKRGLQCLCAARANSNDLQRLEVDLTFALFTPLASIQGYASPDVESLLQRLLQLCDGIRDSAVTAAALSATWIVRMVRGECLAAKDVGLRMISLARSAKDDMLLMSGHSQVEIACHHMGEFRQAQEHADEAIALEPVGRYSDRRLLSILDPVVAALAESSRNLVIMGYPRRAREHSDRAVDIGRRIGHPDSLAFAWFFHALNRGFCGDWNSSVESADTGISLASENDSVQTLAWNRTARGWALAHIGRVDEGIQELAAGIGSSRTIMGQVGFPQQSLMMAEALLLKGDVDSAQQWLDAALELSLRQFDRYFDAELHRVSAVCLLKKGEREAAQTRLLGALDVARSQEAALFELRAALTLAEHDLKGWQKPLSSALARFPEPELWPDVERAQRYLP